LLAHALHAAGRDREARALLDELLTRAKTQPVAESLIALLYDDFGETEKAIEWLRKAVASFDWAAQRYSVMPVFDHLRANPRAAALLDKTIATN
jgi:tetratricopeptide (TPR) repeat protein